MTESAEATILIADDHALIRKGLYQVLDRGSSHTILETDNGTDALNIIRTHQPDIAILDIEMPGNTGFEVAQQVHREGLSVDIIFLTMFKDETMFNNAMDIGVKGYVLKENTVTEIEACLEQVIKGNPYISPAISAYLIKRNQKLNTISSDKDGLHLLTPAEMTIMKLLSQMLTNQEIAEAQSVSIKTVQNHRNNICKKLDLSGTHALLKFALEHKERL